MGAYSEAPGVFSGGSTSLGIHSLGLSAHVRAGGSGAVSVAASYSCAASAFSRTASRTTDSANDGW